MAKTRVCLNVMSENDQIRGPVRYIYEIIANMPTSDFDMYLVAGKWQKNIFASLEEKVNVIYFDINRNKVYRSIFLMLYMAWFIIKNKIDIYHIPDTNPVPIFRNKTKVISTIHDCAEFVVPERFSPIQAIYRKIISRVQAKLSDVIITISLSSKKDIVKYHHVSEKKVNVIYCGIKKFPEKLEHDNISIESESYVLYVGVLEKEKNVDRLVNAFLQLKENERKGIKLYLVGRKGNGYKDIEDILRKYPSKNIVKIFGYVDDVELHKIYENALLFVYMSEYEGFGLPVLEAMQYGIPVMTTNKTSLKEIAGDAALLSDTTVIEIKNNLSMLLGDEKLREEYRERGNRKVLEFSWEKAAIETKEIYKQIMHHN